MTNTNEVRTNGQIIAALAASDISVSYAADNGQSVAVSALVELDHPTEIEVKALSSAVKKLAKKAIAVHHAELYGGDVFRAIANSEYTCTYGNESFRCIVPAISVMQPEARTKYDEACTYMQKFLAEYLNTFSNEKISPAAKGKVRGLLKARCQDVSELFKASSKDDTSLYINERDIDLLASGIVKCSKHEFSTIGEKSVQSFIETMFYHKIHGKEYYVQLYTKNKNLANLVDRPAEKSDKAAEKPSGTPAA